MYSGRVNQLTGRPWRGPMAGLGDTAPGSIEERRVSTVRRTTAKPMGMAGSGAFAWLPPSLAPTHCDSGRQGKAATIPVYGNGATLRLLGLDGGGSG